MERATGLSLHRIKLAKGVPLWAHAKVSINSFQYLRQEIKNINPVAQTRCPNKNIHAQTDKLFIPKSIVEVVFTRQFYDRVYLLGLLAKFKGRVSEPSLRVRFMGRVYRPSLQVKFSGRIYGLIVRVVFTKHVYNQVY